MVTVHACWRDEECREYGAPKRLYINTKRFGGITIGARSQAWLPILGYLPPKWWAWWWIVYAPPERFRLKPGIFARRANARREGLSSEN